MKIEITGNICENIQKWVSSGRCKDQYRGRSRSGDGDRGWKREDCDNRQ